ncbi:MAG: tetratricopeptide repeat protein [bacterium]|nr:tetratricopeptide repeat protein [bacterium]
MNRKRIYYILIFLSVFLLFFNGWVEDKVFELELKPRLNKPFLPVDENYGMLQARYSELLLEKGRFDALLEGTLALSNLYLNKEACSQYTNAYSSYSRKLTDMKSGLEPFRNANEAAYQEVQVLLGDAKASMEKGTDLFSAFQSIEGKKHLYAEWASTTESHVQALTEELSLKNEEVRVRMKPKSFSALTALLSKVKGTGNKPVTPLSIKPEEIIEAMNVQERPQNRKESMNLYTEGTKLMEAGAVDEAMKKFKQSVELDKNNYKAMQSIAEVYIVNKEFNSAIRIINTAIDVYKKNNNLQAR